MSTEEKLFGKIDDVDIDAFISAASDDRNKFLKLKRSTFTRKVAATMRPYYHKVLSTRKSLFIPLDEFPRNRIDTLYKKVTDGLLWLREKLPEDEAMKYDALFSRTQIIKQHQPKPGIWIRLIRDDEYFDRKLEMETGEKPAEVKVVPKSPAASTQDTLLADLAEHLNDKKGMFERKGLNIPTEMQEKIVELCKGFKGVFPFVDDSTVRVFKQ